MLDLVHLKEGGTVTTVPQAQSTVLPSPLVMQVVTLRKQSSLILQFQTSLLNVKPLQRMI